MEAKIRQLTRRPPRGAQLPNRTHHKAWHGGCHSGQSRLLELALATEMARDYHDFEPGASQGPFEEL